MMSCNYSAPLGFCSLARSEKRRIRSIWVICEDSSITATQLEGKRRGVLSSYDELVDILLFHPVKSLCQGDQACGQSSCTQRPDHHKSMGFYNCISSLFFAVVQPQE